MNDSAQSAAVASSEEFDSSSSIHLLFGILPSSQVVLPVTQFAERLYVSKALTITARIIGQSHQISYEAQGADATEALMCPPTGFDTSSVEGRWDALIPHGPMRVSETIGGVLKIETVLLRKPFTLLEKKRLKLFLSLEGAFSHRFPGHNESHASGWTAIQADAERRVVRTLHLYPEENRIVWSRTRLRLLSVS
ncbi:MAG: DUF2617 family protein [Magnetococcales bacterium]|nr:DUF2617 family protein [Magnetococcales bacterium]